MTRHPTSTPARADRRTKFLTQQETRALFNAIDSKRDHAIFLIAYRHGLRASEVGLLRTDDLDLQQYRWCVESDSVECSATTIERQRDATQYFNHTHVLQYARCVT